MRHRKVCQWSANRLVIAATSSQSSAKYHARSSLPRERISSLWYDLEQSLNSSVLQLFCFSRVMSTYLWAMRPTRPPRTPHQFPLCCCGLAILTFKYHNPIIIEDMRNHRFSSIFRVCNRTETCLRIIAEIRARWKFKILRACRVGCHRPIKLPLRYIGL